MVFEWKYFLMKLKGLFQLAWRFGILTEFKVFRRQKPASYAFKKLQNAMFKVEGIFYSDSIIQTPQSIHSKKTLLFFMNLLLYFPSTWHQNRRVNIFVLEKKKGWVKKITVMLKGSTEEQNISILFSWEYSIFFNCLIKDDQLIMYRNIFYSPQYWYCVVLCVWN